jgi:oxygen-independent coproporphyrinogen III oxidase
VDEELACAMYSELVERSGSAGFTQYEIANFAQGGGSVKISAGNPPDLRADGRSQSSPPIPARACRHNVNYWRGGSYYGLGPSAAGYVAGVRTKNWSNTTIYCEQLEKGRRAIESKEELPPLKRAGETAAFGLRMNAGWGFAPFHQSTGYDLRLEWKTEIGQLVERGWGDLNEERFRLTPEGLRFADAAAEMFLR